LLFLLSGGEVDWRGHSSSSRPQEAYISPLRERHRWASCSQGVFLLGSDGDDGGGYHEP
jgi:hypothetical protein